jgi:rhodanese-related sulfurtransferase
VAATLTEYGLTATDLIGGARAWMAAGFPISQV